ncbi:hypothetical protein BRC71_07010 [Halobacteriales archaeon QH_7_65_31]|nr:MAG: hypothetical protein BRC71_07010 [Halobacteriales archaeon QH_7_65_31]
MDAACSNVARVAGTSTHSVDTTATKLTFGTAAWFAFDWLGLARQRLGYRDADHPPATGYRPQP